jgi:queuine tRNA-ribosyltransferase catalytic subunit
MGVVSPSHLSLSPFLTVPQGYPEDLIVSIALGADMFDCVWPTRTARFGNAITSAGNVNIRNAIYTNDHRPIEANCQCTTCRPRSEGGLGITRAYVHHLTNKETVGAHLLSMHNIHYQLNLMKDARAAIIEDRFPAFVKLFFARLYPDKADFPVWAVDALRGVGVEL